MAKQLLIVRHGKAVQAEAGMQDFIRNLTASGTKDVVAVAEKLLQKNLVSELLISSNAKRALKTAQLFAATWNIPVDSIQLEPGIYEADVKTLVDVVESIDNDYDFVAIFGHNPGFTGLVNKLSPTSIYDLATAGAALITFDVSDWRLVTAGGELTLLIEP